MVGNMLAFLGLLFSLICSSEEKPSFKVGHIASKTTNSTTLTDPQIKIGIFHWEVKRCFVFRQITFSKKFHNQNAMILSRKFYNLIYIAKNHITLSNLTLKNNRPKQSSLKIKMGSETVISILRLNNTTF